MTQKPALAKSYAPRNVHPFISRLPTDILEDIFIQYASDYHYGYDGCPTPAAPSWVNVSYVCHHWRHVALNCATLWTHFFITSRRWTEELLARSRQASLKIRFRLYKGSGSQWSNTVTVEKVMNHLERIQELCLDLSKPYEQVLSKLSSPAPRLQTLDIKLYVDSPPEWPSLLFAGVPPALHTLKLSGCRVPLSSFKLNALTTLGLYNVPDQFLQNVEEFLAVMCYLENVEHLYLDGALASATGFLSSAAFRTFKKIDSPRLSFLLIGAPVSTTIALLSCVNIPSKTTVKLETMVELGSPFHNYAVIYSLLTERCSMAEDHALSSSTILSLDIDFVDGRSSGTLAFSAAERDFVASSAAGEDEDWASTIRLRIRFDLSEDDGDSEALINNICCSMPLSNVRSLGITLPPFSPTFWRNMLGRLPDIRYIELQVGNMPDLSVLSLTTDEGVRHQSHMLAPNLEELVVHSITFLPEGDSADLLEPAITRRSLLDALSTRRGPHGRLIMTDCDYHGFYSVMVWGDGGIHVVSDFEDKVEWLERLGLRY